MYPGYRKGVYNIGINLRQAGHALVGWQHIGMHSLQLKHGSLGYQATDDSRLQNVLL